MLGAHLATWLLEALGYPAGYAACFGLAFLDFDAPRAAAVEEILGLRRDDVERVANDGLGRCKIIVLQKAGEDIGKPRPVDLTCRALAVSLAPGREDRGVLASGFGSSIRMVTHYDVSRADIETALQALREVLG